MSTRSGVTPTLIGGNVPRRMARIPAGGSARPNSCSISLSSLRTSSKSLVSKLPNRFANMALLLVDDTGDLEIGACPAGFKRWTSWSHEAGPGPEDGRTGRRSGERAKRTRLILIGARPLDLESAQYCGATPPL